MEGAGKSGRAQEASGIRKRLREVSARAALLGMDHVGHREAAVLEAVSHRDAGERDQVKGSRVEAQGNGGCARTAIPNRSARDIHREGRVGFAFVRSRPAVSSLHQLKAGRFLSCTET